MRKQSSLINELLFRWIGYIIENVDQLSYIYITTVIYSHTTKLASQDS